MNDEMGRTALPSRTEGGQALDDPSFSSQRVIRIGSRFGVWGLVGGFGAMTAFTLGAPVSVGFAISAMGVGLLASGLGTLAASFAVLRRSGPTPRLIRVASMAGIPLGGALALLGLTSVALWSPLVSIVNTVTPVAAVLGVVVLVLLVVGFVIEWQRGSGPTQDIEGTPDGVA